MEFQCAKNGCFISQKGRKMVGSLEYTNTTEFLNSSKRLQIEIIYHPALI